MKAKSFLAVFVSLIFLGYQLRLFFMAMEKKQALVLGNTFVMFFVICIFLFAIALFVFLKYGGQRLNPLEFVSLAFVLVSMFFITLNTNGIAANSTLLTHYMGYALVILSGIGCFKYKHRINLSFLAWGLFVILWSYYLNSLVLNTEGTIIT